MEINRRLVLKGMALSSFAGFAIESSADESTEAAASTANASSRPLLALVNDDAAGSAFLHGARASGGTQLQTRRISGDLQVMLNLERELRGSRALRFIGLLDDAAGTLVVDLARSAGARVRWLGQHTAHASATHHRLLHADNADECARHLGRQLRACGVGFHIVSQHHGDTNSQHQLSGPPHADSRAADWASALGYLLASLDTPSPTAAPATAASLVADGRFVSFSIEV